MCTPYMARGEGMFLVPLAPGPGPWTAQSPVLDAWQHGLGERTQARAPGTCGKSCVSRVFRSYLA